MAALFLLHDSVDKGLVSVDAVVIIIAIVIVVTIASNVVPSSILLATNRVVATSGVLVIIERQPALVPCQCLVVVLGYRYVSLVAATALIGRKCIVVIVKIRAIRFTPNGGEEGIDVALGVLSLQSALSTSTDIGVSGLLWSFLLFHDLLLTWAD